MLSMIASVLISITSPCETIPFPGDPLSIFDVAFSCPSGTSERYEGCILDNLRDYMQTIALWGPAFHSEIEGCCDTYGPNGTSPDPARLAECTTYWIGYYNTLTVQLKASTLAHMADCCEAQASMMVMRAEAPPCDPIAPHPHYNQWVTSFFEHPYSCPAGSHESPAG